MRPGPAWAWGLALSGLLHAAAAVILVPLYEPRPLPSQPPPETRLDMETVEAPQQDATPRDPEAETAAEARAEGTTLGAGAVPQSDARPLATQTDRQAAIAPGFERAAIANPAITSLAPAASNAGRVAAVPSVAEVLRPAKAAVVSAEVAAPSAEALSPATAEASRLSAENPDAISARAAVPAADTPAIAEVVGEVVRPAAPPTAQMADTTPVAEPLSAARPTPNQFAAAVPRPDAARPATLAANNLAAVQPDTTIGTARLPTVTPAAVVIPATANVPSQAAVPAIAAPITVTPEGLPATEATGQQTAALKPQGAQLPSTRPDMPGAREAVPRASSAKAALAWQFGDRVVTDPQALATIQAFMEPAALDDAQGVKDDLSSVLTGVDCARLSATFIPETGQLEMRGHIPDPELQGPILAALQAQVGEGIPVAANLLHLPAPQCGALTGIANVGLPQSTDQFTNARLIGETAHAREYSYTEGQRLQFDLTAPDYDAYVYVDYFTADGEVIHLIPNDTIPLEEHPAKSVFGVGKDRPGRPGLHITIGPPFGQEIAVAFAASHRLYEGVRPIVEPAGPYLEELQARVAEARAAHTDFKGEWVYFFITTAPATQ